MNYRRVVVNGLLVVTVLLLGSALAQTPATQPDQAAARRGRGQARGPATNPSMVQDAAGTWYTPMKHAEYAFGADLSSLKQIEEGGKQFKDTDGQVKPALAIFQSHGYNWIRIRTCVPPVNRGLAQTKEYTTALAKDAKKLGYKFILDLHYSNGWADPTNEPTPAAWQEMSVNQMSQALFEYTRDTIAYMAEQGALPDMIQVGNEIGNGFLWPTADIRRGENWGNFTKLLYSGINGIDAGRGNGKRPIIMIHVDHGGNIPLTKAFFDRLNSYDIPYDVIGFSFYPWSHGTLVDLKANLTFAAETYNKDVYVVETGYYHTPSQYFRDLPGPFPETPQGQAQWLDAVNQIVMDVPDGHGKGVFWWEPAGSGGLVNRGYFDQDGNAQAPIFDVFNRFTRPIHRTDRQ